MLLSLFSQMFFCRNEYIYYPVFTCKRIECNERFPQSEKVVIESYFLIASDSIYRKKAATNGM